MSTLVEYPWALLAALPFAAAVALVLALAFQRRRRRLQRMGASELVARLMPAAAMRAPWLRAALLGAAAACGAVALSGPRWGMETTVQHANGVDVVLVLDASLSMLAPDERPSRLERMKEETRRLLALSPGDRIGLIAFAGRSYVLSPLTVDRGALQLFIDNLDPSVVGQAGSSLSRAIEQGTQLLVSTPSGSDKALVIMSDGESWEPTEDIVAAARKASEAGITLITVGFGRTTGATIPVPVPGGTQPKRDADGKVVVTRYSPEMLEAAAGARGTFIPAPATDKAARVRRALSSLKAAGRKAQRATDRRARFQLFLIPALLLALVDTLLAERRGYRPARAAAATTAVGVMLALALLPAAALGQARSGEALYRAGRYKEAAEAYARAAQDAPGTASLEYDLGTSLLAAGQFEDATSALERAVTSAKDLDLRYRALYNLGLAFLRQAQAAHADEAAQAYASATEAYRRALHLRPEDRDAKWNYELANHARRQGGGERQQSNSNPNPSRSIDKNQAQQLLNSAQREEREAQAKKQRQNAPDRPPGGKDW